MKIIENIATESLLGTMLIQTIRIGVCCAQNEKKEREKGNDILIRDYAAGKKAAADILASIWGLCSNGTENRNLMP